MIWPFLEYWINDMILLIYYFNYYYIIIICLFLKSYLINVAPWKLNYGNYHALDALQCCIVIASKIKLVVVLKTTVCCGCSFLQFQKKKLVLPIFIYGFPSPSTFPDKVSNVSFETCKNRNFEYWSSYAF